MASRRRADDDDDGPVASTSSLAAISQPVVVYKAKRQRHSEHLDDADEHLAPICAFPALSPYEAAHSDVPRRRRRRAYLEASKSLNNLCEEALDDVAAPTVERLRGWLEDAAKAATTRGTKTISLAALQSLLPQSDLYQRVVAQCSQKGKGKTAAGTAWAHLSLAHCQASSAARLIEVIVEQWLAQIGKGQDTASAGSGATSSWHTLQQRHRLLPTSSRPRTYVLSLAGLPQAPLFSTLAYLANLPTAGNDDDSAPQLNVAIVLQCCQGPAGLDGVPWEDKRGLDVDVLQMGGGWDARKLISRIASTPGLGPRRAGSGGALSPAMLRAAYQRAKENPSSPSAAIEAMRGWLDLALQRHFTTSLRSLGSPFVSTSSSNTLTLSPSDFTPAFFTQLRGSLVRSLSTPASDSSGSDDDDEDRMDVDVKPGRRRKGKPGGDEPNLSCLPQWLREDKQKLRAIMKGEDDATLLQLWLSSLAGQEGAESSEEQGQQQRGGQNQQELGLELLALGMPQGSASTSASATDKRDLEALRYALATSAAPTSITDDEDDEDDAATRTAAQLRRKVNNILAPRLKALRRPAEEATASPSTPAAAGAEPLAALESWLDRIEDWADAPSEDDAEHSQSINSSTKFDLLLRIRALQQELAACLASSSTADAPAAVTTSPRGSAPRSPDVAAVSRRLLREERIRTLRSSIADWYGSTTRRLLLSSATSHHARRPLFSDLFADSATSGLEGVATLESIAADGACPRAAITLGLARPGVYLEHFAATEEATLRQSTEQGDAAEGVKRERLSKLKGMLGQKSQKEPRTPSKKRKRSGRGTQQDEDDDEDDEQLRSSFSSMNEAQTDLSIAYSLLLEAGGPGGGTRGRLVNLDDWYRAWLAVRGSPPAATATAAANKGKAKHEGEGEADPQARFALALSTLALLGYVKKTTRGAGGAGRTKADGKGQSQRGAPGVRVAKVGGWDRVLGLREEEGLGVADGEEEDE